MRQAYIKKETVIVHNNEGYKKTYAPWGVQSVIFQEQQSDNYL